jgi:hypothetical protein
MDTRCQLERLFGFAVVHVAPPSRETVRPRLELARIVV